MIALVVDDDPTIRDFIKAILEADGFAILEAEGGRRALEIVNVIGSRLSLIVSDIQMPQGDGLSFALEVRRRYPTLPILLASGRAQPEEAFDFLPKPFSWSAMRQAVRRLVGPTEKTA